MSTSSASMSKSRAVLALVACSCLIGLAILLGSRPLNQIDGLEIIPRGSTLGPDTGLEIRFHTAVVSEDSIGGAEADSPLLIRPPIAGHFEWISPRSGVFTPNEPLPLGARYR